MPAFKGHSNAFDSGFEIALLLNAYIKERGGADKGEHRGAP